MGVVDGFEAVEGELVKAGDLSPRFQGTTLVNDDIIDTRIFTEFPFPLYKNYVQQTDNQPQTKSERKQENN